MFLALCYAMKLYYGTHLCSSQAIFWFMIVFYRYCLQKSAWDNFLFVEWPRKWEKIKNTKNDCLISLSTALVYFTLLNNFSRWVQLNHSEKIRFVICSSVVQLRLFKNQNTVLYFSCPANRKCFTTITSNFPVSLRHQKISLALQKSWNSRISEQILVYWRFKLRMKRF